MDVVLVSSLLGAFVPQVAPTKGTLKVSVWPPGSEVFLGESVLLLCTVESGSGFQWSFSWSEPAATTDPRHRVSGRPPPSLLTPSSRQLFRGEVFTVRCPPGWRPKTKRSNEEEGRVVAADQGSPPGGVVAADDPAKWAMTAVGGGLYWCEGAGGRSDVVFQG
ncbi:uncharacterized protein AB9W97_015923 isoform 2-T2 [Spinachia spinachia]